MKLKFNTKIPQAEKEYDKLLTEKEKARLSFILSIITEHGLKNVNPKLAKHLWDDIYEIKPDSKRVIYVQIDSTLGIVIKVYTKQGNKMPKHIKDSIKERRKQLD